MKKTLLDGWKSLLRLLRFVFWYGFAVAVLLYLLPAAGLLLEQHYEALSSTVKFFSVLGLFAVIGAWQILSIRDRR
jgi:uncharacterized membrane protein